MKNAIKKPSKPTASKSKAPRGTKCGICREHKPFVSLVKTKCCKKWVHNDLGSYRPFSFGFDSCYRNHERYTMCGFHYTEGHSGKWKECSNCTKFSKENPGCHEDMFDFPDTDDEKEAKTSKKAAPKPSPKPKTVSKPAKKAVTKADAVSKTKYGNASAQPKSSLEASTSIVTRSRAAKK